MLLHLIIIHAILSLVEGQCSVTVGGPSTNKPCVFPFRFRGVTYRQCTTVLDPDDRPWCSVKTDRNGEHVSAQGQWGYCVQGCEGGKQQQQQQQQNELERNNNGNEEDDDVFDGVVFANNGGKTKPRKKVRTTTTPTPRPRTTTRRPRTTTRRPRTTTRRPRTTSTPRRRRPNTRKPQPISSRQPFQNGSGTGTSTLPLKGVSRKSESGTWLPDPLLEECGYDTNVGFVLGGQQAIRGQFAFIALLGYRGFGDNKVYYLCGGSLINRRYIMTAAHCHEANTPTGQISEVLLGEFDVGRDPDCQGCRRAEKFFISPRAVTVNSGFNLDDPLSGDDIALVRLPRLATTIYETTASIVMPACLPWMEPSGAPAPTKELYTAGWGRLSNEASSGSFHTLGVQSRTLQKLRMDVQDGERCDQSYNRRITPKFLCAGGIKGEDTCNGDSGGPLIGRLRSGTPNYLHGIISFGSDKCGIGFPAAFTNVMYYKDWIIANMKP